MISLKRFYTDRRKLKRASQLGLGVVGYVIAISLIGGLGVAVALGIDTWRVRTSAQQLRMMSDSICGMIASNPISQAEAAKRFESYVSGYVQENYLRGSTLTGAYLSIPWSAGYGVAASGSFALTGCPGGATPVDCRFFSNAADIVDGQGSAFGPLPPPMQGVQQATPPYDSGIGQRVTCEFKAHVKGLFSGFLNPSTNLAGQEIRARSVWRLRLRAPLIPEDTADGMRVRENLALVIAPQLETNVWSQWARRPDPRFKFSLDSETRRQIGLRLGRGTDVVVPEYPLGMRSDRELRVSPGGPAEGDPYLKKIFQGGANVLYGQHPAIIAPTATIEEQREGLFLALSNPATTVRNKLINSILNELMRTGLDAPTRTRVYLSPSRIGPRPACQSNILLTALHAQSAGLWELVDAPWNRVCQANQVSATSLNNYLFFASAQTKMGYPLYWTPLSSSDATSAINESNDTSSGIVRPLTAVSRNAYNELNLDPPSLPSINARVATQAVTTRWDKPSDAERITLPALIDTIGAVQRCPILPSRELNGSAIYNISGWSEACNVARTFSPFDGASYEGAIETMKGTFAAEPPSHVVLITHLPPPESSDAQNAIIQALRPVVNSNNRTGRGSTIIYIPVRTIGHTDGREKWSKIVASVNQASSAYGSNRPSDDSAVLVVLSPLNTQYQGEGATLRFCQPGECGAADPTAGQLAFQSYWYYLLTTGASDSTNTSETIEAIAKNIVLNSIFRPELAL